MRIKLFNEYISESKQYVYHETFRFNTLIGSNIYPLDLLSKWQQEYEIDEYAFCIFVTESIIDDAEMPKFKNLKLSKSKKSILSFDDEKPKYKGFKPQDSLLKITKDGRILSENEQVEGEEVLDVYLYIFYKNSNNSRRARQLHGFIYEGEIIRLNNLEKLKYTDKWDAFGTLDKAYLDLRANSGKQVQYFNGKEYVSLIEKDPISGTPEINWSGNDGLSEDFKRNFYWNIKNMKDSTDVELGDFKRISGLIFDEQVNRWFLDIPKDEESAKKVEKFIFAVAFHDGSPEKNVLTEYIVLMDLKDWKTLLPDMENILDKINDMYTELKLHRYKKKDKTDDELEALKIEWLKYIAKYRTLTVGKPIKLRFKRDSKGQLRIQSAISYSDFKEIITKSTHIKIS